MEERIITGEEITGDLFEKKHFDETTNDRADRYGTAAACASYFKRSGTARNQPNREWR